MAGDVFSRVEPRQRKLAQIIGERFFGTPNLIPLGRISSFCRWPDGLSLLYDECVWDVAWYAVAERVSSFSRFHRVIDHAWLIGCADHNLPHRPWAMVTEPDMVRNDAIALAHLANDAMAEWGVTVHVLTAEESAWNPGHSLPLVAVFKSVEQFMPSAVTWMMQNDQLATH